MGCNSWNQLLFPNVYGFGNFRGIDLYYRQQKQKFWSEANSRVFRSCTSPCSSIMYNTKRHCEPEKNLHSPSAPPLLYPQAPCWVTQLLNLRRQSLRLCPRGDSVYLLQFSFLFFPLPCIWTFFLWPNPETPAQSLISLFVSLLIGFPECLSK